MKIPMSLNKEEILNLTSIHPDTLCRMYEARPNSIYQWITAAILPNDGKCLIKTQGKVRIIDIREEYYRPKHIAITVQFLDNPNMDNILVGGFHISPASHRVKEYTTLWSLRYVS